MTIKIGSNIASIQAQRRLGEVTSSIGKIYERLSSGQRINTASDDAAGLAIANDLNAKNRVYTQAIRNGNDGISALNIADSALDNLSSVITRIRELAEQSANGTYSNKQRAALDSEAQALKSEFFRISKTTTFNGVKLFDGSTGAGLRLQLGYGIEGSINTSVGGAIGTGTVGAATSFAVESGGSYTSTLGDLNGDGILDLVTAGLGAGSGRVTIRLGGGDGSFGAATSYVSESSVTYAVTLGDLNGDGILDIVTAGATTAVQGQANVRLGNGNGTFGNAVSYVTESTRSSAVTLGDLNQDGILDLITAGRSGNDGYASVRLGVGNGTFGASSTFTTESFFSLAVSLGDLNGDGMLDLVTAGTSDGYQGYATVRLGTGSGSFGTATSFTTEVIQSDSLTLGDVNADGKLDIVTAGFDGSLGIASIHLGNGYGSFSTFISYVAEATQSYDVTLGDLNGDGILDLITAGYTDSGNDGIATTRLGNGNGTFQSAHSYAAEEFSSRAVALGDLNGDGVLDLVTSGLAGGSAGFATIRLGSTQDGLAPLLDFSLKTKADALQSMALFQRTQDNLAKQRGVIGSYQSRVGIALNNLSSSRENFSAAESRIRDADIAFEAGNLVRTQILQQASTSVLAQANQGPQLALALLR